MVWQQDNHITCGMISEALNLVTEALNPWHKVSEELPEENKMVIVAFKFKGEWIYDKGYYADNEWWADSISVLDIIEYWMPIPELSKED